MGTPTNSISSYPQLETYFFNVTPPPPTHYEVILLYYYIVNFVKYFSLKKGGLFNGAIGVTIFIFVSI